MLKKVLVTLKYGETKAKLILTGMGILVISGFCLLVIGIAGRIFLALCAGAVLLIAGLLTLFSFSFVDIDVDIEKNIRQKSSGKNNPEKNGTPEEKKSVTSADSASGFEGDIDFSMFEDELSDVAIGIGKPTQSILDALKKGSDAKEDNDGSETEPSDDGEESLSVSGKEESSGLQDDDSLNEILHDDNSESDDDSDEKEEKSGAKRNASVETIVKKPTPKQIKARKKMLKVRKDDRRYTPIIVDSWKEATALRVPAFVQEKGKTAHIILVEGALRTELMPLTEFLQVTYQKNVEENFMENYDEIKQDADVNAIFGELIPAFYQGGSRGGEPYFCKNLYILGGKIAITPRSLRKLFNKFDFNFKVFD